MFKFTYVKAEKEKNIINAKINSENEVLSSLDYFSRKFVVFMYLS